jgi:hypothetical protein
MAAEAVGFMARGANGGRSAELVTRDFLGGCAAVDDARDAATARHDAVVSSHVHHFFLVPLPCSLRVFVFGSLRLRGFPPFGVDYVRSKLEI